MPRPDTQAFGQIVHAAVIESALADQSQGARNGGRGSNPCGSPRGSLGPASQTGTKSLLRRRGRRGKITDIFLFRRRRGTNRPAINPGGSDRNKKSAVKARIPRQA